MKKYLWFGNGARRVHDADPDTGVPLCGAVITEHLVRSDADHSDHPNRCKRCKRLNP